MLDIGGWEFLIIALVAIVVIGPKDLPAVVRAISSWMAKARELAREFRSGLDELQREVELDGIEKEVRRSIGADEIERTANSIRNEVENTGREIETSADPANPSKDPWEEAYTYFQDQPDVAHEEVEKEAQRRLAEAETEEAERMASTSSPDDPAVSVDTPPSSPAAVGGRTGG